MQELTTTAQTMSSREIAELTRKEHKHVARDIKVLREQLDDMFGGYVQDWTHPQNGVTYKEFILDKDTCLTLLLGYDAQARMRVVKRWQELEYAQKPALPADLSRMEILKLAMESEEARIKAEAERDEAVRTKAQISDRKTATAMATASAKSREVERLKHELGRNQLHATVKAVENVTKHVYDWRPLKKYCKAQGLEARKVVDDQYGTVKAWPAIAWRDVHGIELESIFPKGEQ